MGVEGVSPRNSGEMNRAGLFYLAALAPVLAVRADYKTPFADPPFKLEAPIVGLEGWEPRGVAAQDENSGTRLVKVRWDENRTAAVFYGASIRNAFSETTSSKVRVTARVALTFPTTAPKLQQLRIIVGGAPFGEIVFEGNPEGGLGFGNGTGRNTRVAVPFAQLAPNTYYTITILVNFDSATYDVSMTGVKRDGSALAYEEKDVPFAEGKPSSALKGVLILSSKNIRAYLQQFLVESL
jgi:hypothetical protein